MTTQPPKGFFEQFCVNSGASGQNLSEQAAKLFFETYPDIPGDDDDVPTDSPLMTLLRENLPSMRGTTSDGGRRRRHRTRSGSGRSAVDPYPRATANLDASLPSPSLRHAAHDDDDDDDDHTALEMSLSDHMDAFNTVSRDLLSTLESRQAQKSADNQANRDLKRWIYTTKVAEGQRQREHEKEMETMRMERREHEIQSEIRRLEKEIELQRLKVQELKMRRDMDSCGEGEGN